MPTNDFKPFAVGPGANVVPQVTYSGNAALLANGFQVGIADPQYLNKVWRQSSIMAAAIGEFVMAQTGASVVDDGTTANLVLALTTAVETAARLALDYYNDTGSVANAYVISPAAVTPGQPISLKFRTTRANTGAATIDFGVGAISLKTEQGLALSAGDIPAKAVTLFTYDPALGYAVVTETVFSQLGTLAKMNIGQGTEDDGGGALRVKTADTSIRRSPLGLQTAEPVSIQATNVLAAAVTNGGVYRMVSNGSPTVTLPLSTGLFSGYAVTVVAQNKAVSVIPNVADAINQGAAGAVFTVLKSQSVRLVCDGAGNWTPLFASTPQGAYSPMFLNAAQTVGAGTYQVDTSAGPVSLTLVASPTAGTTLEFSDPFGTWGTNNFTLLRNGGTIYGSATDLVCDVSGETFRAIFDGTDWRLS